MKDDAPLPSPEAEEPVQDAPPAVALEQEEAPLEVAPPLSRPALPFPVVGVGASGGGLPALQAFLSGLPADVDATFVLLLAATPEHERPDALGAHGPLPVTPVEGDTPLEPGRVYVAPAGQPLALRDGRLRLEPPNGAPAATAPIDHFFRSLAVEQGAQAAAVVLSGTGADGAQGLRAVKEAGGLALVQAPEEAAFDGMPRAALATELVDVTAPAAALARRAVEILRNGRRADGEPRRPEAPAPADDPGEQAYPDDVTDEALAEVLPDVLAELRARTGHEFAPYRRATVLRRLRRRLHITGADGPDAYLLHLRASPEEQDALYRDLLISVTQFFRDPAAFDALEREVIPRLFAGKGPGERVRVWVPGCATGEEAYSLAILLSEHAVRHRHPVELQVFATDLDEHALGRAREGRYPETIAADVSPERLQRFFVRDAEGYRVRPELREAVLFAAHSLLENPPFARLDLVSCRNVLIYLDRRVQRRVFELFHYALLPEGHLFLGSSESADAVPGLFDPVDRKHRLYRRRAASGGPPPLPSALPPRGAPAEALAAPGSGAASPGVEALYRAWAVGQHGPPRVLVDERRAITHVFGDVSPYLTVAEGEATQQVLPRVIEPLRGDLRVALFEAAETGVRSAGPFVRVAAGGRERLVRVCATPVQQPGLPRGLVEVAFEEVAPDVLAALGGDGAAHAPDGDGVARLEAELRQTRARLQAVVEEHQSNGEALRASNEALRAVNEELQSTTEELESGKEELQSMNEELVTINQELKGKVEELGRVNADLQTLMASTDIATVFLDGALRLQRYTPRATDVLPLRPADAGRPVGDLAHGLDGVDLPALARGVLADLAPYEAEVASRDGRWFRLRIVPYRAVEGRADGVAVTLVDITGLKEVEHALLRRAREQAAVADLGQLALEQPGLDALFEAACARVAEALSDDYAKVLELTPDRRALRLRAGVGWHDGLVGAATVPNDARSQAGYTLEAAGPVIVNDFATEDRFGAPELLTSHGVVSGMSVTIPGVRGPFGVIGTHSRRPRAFYPDDARFLQAVAHILGEAVRREADAAALAARAETIRRQLAEIEGVYASAPVGLSWTDRQHRYVRLNERLAEINGAPVRAHLGRTIGELLPDMWPRLRPILERVLRTGEPVLQVELRGRTAAAPDEERAWLASYYPFRDAAGKVLGVNGAVLDVTALKRAERAVEEINRTLEGRVAEATGQVRRLAAALGRIERRERAHIAQILHDDVQQLLYGLRLKLDLLGGDLPEGAEAAREHLARARALADDAIAHTRGLTLDLAPPVLREEGLDNALRWLAQHMAETHGLTVHVAGGPAPAMATEARQLLFEVTRELLFNVAKHAGTAEAEVTVEEVADELQVTVTDRGAGFDPSAAQRRRRFGLFNARERLALAGGRFDVASAPGEGARVTMALPLEALGSPDEVAGDAEG